MADDSEKGVLDVEPHTRADREFRLAYRSNLGRRVESERLSKASDAYLREVLECCQDGKLARRIEALLAERSSKGTGGLWQAIKTIFKRS